MGFWQKLFGGRSTPSDDAEPSRPVRYRGFVFAANGNSALLADDQKIVRGIWYRDPSSLQNATRHRMVVASASTLGLEALPSDYETTVISGVGGSENVPEIGGAILWFASAQEILEGR